LPNLPSDLLGHLYRPFDPQRIQSTIPPELRKWIADKGLI
jgi:hypothetical protein